MTRNFLGSALVAIVVLAGLSSCGSLPKADRSNFQYTSHPYSLIPWMDGINLCAIHMRDGAPGSQSQTACIVLYLRSASLRAEPFHLKYPPPYRKGERVFYALQTDFGLKEIPLPNEVARTLPAGTVFSSEESATVYREEIIPRLFTFK